MSQPRVIMVAPNGARRTAADHPALPMTLDDLARTAAACAEAGAQAIHAHVRDAAGKHVLDAGLYTDLLARVRREAGADFIAQITTEAVNRYAPPEQMAVVRAVHPRAVSCALKEIMPDEADEHEAATFYAWLHTEAIAVQHILYSADEVRRFAALARRGLIPGDRYGVLFVLGRYTTNQQSAPTDLLPFIAALDETGLVGTTQWMVCGFGQGETAALTAALALGGHARVGFENSLWHADGTVATDNAQRVAVIEGIAATLARPRADPAMALAVLGAAG